MSAPERHIKIEILRKRTVVAFSIQVLVKRHPDIVCRIFTSLYAERLYRIFKKHHAIDFNHCTLYLNFEIVIDIRVEKVFLGTIPESY